eukprot:TRINITY_DN31087_c0_g1_i1.p1 TRINITY_DN31087_c0_g1~~TRINITY_DN31087_c0_g1_i1.p1  ORF type:complete len:256 (-),score=42.85 TRINITY_DN31087_c0_g1_i1:56-823(-)
MARLPLVFAVAALVAVPPKRVWAVPDADAWGLQPAAGLCHVPGTNLTMNAGVCCATFTIPLVNANNVACVGTSCTFRCASSKTFWDSLPRWAWILIFFFAFCCGVPLVGFLCSCCICYESVSWLCGGSGEKPAKTRGVKKLPPRQAPRSPHVAVEEGEAEPFVATEQRQVSQQPWSPLPSSNASTTEAPRVVQQYAQPQMRQQATASYAVAGSGIPLMVASQPLQQMPQAQAQPRQIILAQPQSAAPQMAFQVRR